MREFIEVGDQVQLDCTAESKALASLKKRLAGRIGVVVGQCSETPGVAAFDYTVRFPRVGRKAEIELDLHFSILDKTQRQN